METQHHHHHHQQSPLSPSLLSPSPHLTSSQKLADIAARVVSELHLNGDDPFDYDHDFFPSLHHHPNDTVLSPNHHQNHSSNDDHNDNHNDNDNDEDDDDSEFEFAILCGDHNSSPISADDIFSNGQIKPTYPLFDTSLLHQNDAVSSNQSQPSIRLPLRKLMSEDRECVTNSCSSSEADDLEGVPQDTYCVWVPKEKNKIIKSQNDDVLMRKKSKSTGSNSKRWRIRDLVHRSNSDGKDTFVFLTPNHHHQQHQHRHGNHHQHGGDPKKRSQQVPVTKNKTYLPYRQDLVGLFSRTNGIKSKNTYSR